MIPLTHLLVSLFASNIQAQPHVVEAECQSVHGQIEARVDAVRATLAGLRFKGGGSSTGDWAGPVQVQVLKRFAEGLEITLRIATDQGTVSAQGKAIAPIHPTLSHTREISSDLEVLGGSGAFNLLTGTLRAVGAADTRARTIQVDFAGEICKAPQSQSVLVDASPIAARYHLEKQLWGGV